MEIEFEPSVLDPHERLLYALYSSDIVWKKDFRDFEATHKGVPVKLSGSHLTERSDGGGIMGAMLGIRSKITRDYWTFKLSMGTAGRYDRIEIATGDFSSHIDDLLADLFWHVYNTHHDRKVSEILAKLEGK